MSTQLQLPLVQTTGQQVFTTSLIIAEGCDEGGTDADDPSGTVGVARGTRGSPASDIPRRF